MKKNSILMFTQWHFVEMPAFLFSVAENYFTFGLHFFSIPTLLVTLFSPWRHYQSRNKRGFDLGQFLGNLIYNLFSRVMGFFCRLFLIVAGLIFQIGVVVLGFFIIVGWVVLPLIIVVLLLMVLYV